MMLEQFIAEAHSARHIFHCPSMMSASDADFLPTISFIEDLKDAQSAHRSLENQGPLQSSVFNVQGNSSDPIDGASLPLSDEVPSLPLLDEVHIDLPLDEHGRFPSKEKSVLSPIQECDTPG